MFKGKNDKKLSNEISNNKNKFSLKNTYDN